MIDQIGNLITEHPYASAGLGTGMLITSSLLSQAALNEYGDNLNINSITIPTPTYTNPNFSI